MLKADRPSLDYDDIIREPTMYIFRYYKAIRINAILLRVHNEVLLFKGF